MTGPSLRNARELLEPERVVVFDGATGTMLYAKGVFINQCYDQLNTTQPDLVREVHRAYLDAGAEVVETNSFGANRLKLAQYGLESHVEELNARAAELAREARAIFREQLAALRAGGADLFILETFADLSEIEQAVLAARDVDASVPLIAQMTIGTDGLTPYGASPEDVARALTAAGVDVVGLNCSVGPQGILEAIERMAAVTTRKLSAMPNAGMPREVGGRSMYMASPEYLASYGRHLLQAGVKLIGGCCGTTPEHIKALVEGIRPLVPRQRALRSTPPRQQPAVAEGDAARLAQDRGVPEVPFAQRSKWARRIAAGDFVSSVEIVPPRGVDATKMLQGVEALKRAGVDAVNVPDGPRAQSRMGALLTSLLIEQRIGIETVTHYCCRDRNLLGMLSDLLGAAAMGLRNMLIITGDPPKMGPYPNATAVFDIDAIGLTNLVRNLNRGLDPGGNAIGTPTCFAIGVGVNPAAIDPAYEIRRFEWKVDAGAEYAITQPVFDAAQLERFLERIKHVRIPIIAGIWPLVSARNAEFLANEVPGVVVPPEIIARMRRANEQSKEHAVAEGIAIAREMLERVRPSVQGVQVSAPFGKVELALEVFREHLVPAAPSLAS
jgi:homocysteine S-methyltransferase